MTKKQLSTPEVIVGTVKKAIAAIASRGFRRKASPRLGDSGFLGARFIPREIVRSELSKLGMRTSPWMGDASQVGFSVTMRKIDSRTSLDVGRRPMGFLSLEISFHYNRKLARCQRPTVSGVTMMRDCFRPDQIR